MKTSKLKVGKVVAQRALYLDSADLIDPFRDTTTRQRRTMVKNFNLIRIFRATITLLRTIRKLDLIP